MSASQLWVLAANAAVLGIPVALAWIWGRSPEKIVASTFVAAMLVDVFTTGRSAGGLSTTLSISGISSSGRPYMAVLFFVALKANRFYPIWLSSFQIVVVLSHFTRGVSAREAPLAYALLTYGPYVFQIIILTFGIALHRAPPASIRSVSLLADWLEAYGCDEPWACAERLVTQFGSVLRAMRAQDRDLVKVEPRDREVVSLLRSAQALIVAALREEIPRATVRSDDERFHGYLRFLLAGQRVETLHATFLGPAGRYLHDEIVESGTTVRRGAGRARSRAQGTGARRIGDHPRSQSSIGKL